MQGGRAFGILVILVTLAAIALGVQYNAHLEQQRAQAIAQLVSTPEYRNCRYDASTCPQSEGNVALPGASAVGIVILGILLGIYLIRSDTTQRRILSELAGKRKLLDAQERRDVLLSVLKDDERRVIAAVMEQPGISQATLRLRTDMSKAKLSMLLKELEERGLITRVEEGKTNTVHLKREL